MKYYNSMYKYAEDADITHYKVTVGGHTPLVLVTEFHPQEDSDMWIDWDNPIEYESNTYLPINWGEPGSSAILESAANEICWIRYIPGNHEGTYVSDGRVYPSEKAAMKG